MEFFDAVAKRKSIRSYLDMQIGRGLLEKIVEAGNKAPCAGAIQISVITDKEYLAEIDEVTFSFMQNSGVEFLVKRSSMPGYRPLYSAPALIVISSDPERGTANVAAAAATMTFAATDLGLGSCYVGSPTRVLQAGNELAEKLNLQDGFTPLAGVLLGYTDDPDVFSRERIVPDNVTWVE
jgi:nitroreductase